MSVQQLRAATDLHFLMGRLALLRVAKASFVASVFPLLFVPPLISQMFLSYRMSFWLFSVLGLACGAVSSLTKDSACELPPLPPLPGSEISLVSETARRLSQFPQIDRAVVLR